MSRGEYVAGESVPMPTLPLDGKVFVCAKAGRVIVVIATGAKADAKRHSTPRCFFIRLVLRNQVVLDLLV